MPPPRPPAKPTLSSSREVVPVGPREVFKKHHGRERDANGNKPLTARALVLRNGKYGAMGTGEIVLASRMSGREKLDLLAEDLVKQAIAAPFKLDVCLKIADSQLGAYLDEINALHDPERFADRIIAEVNSHTSAIQRKNLKEPSMFKAHMVSMCASHIHNMYMMASGWRVVGDLIRDLVDDGLDDAAVKAQIRTNASMRSRFLVLYDTVNVLVQAGQKNFAVLAATAPHYFQYFKKDVDRNTGESEYTFDWSQLKAIHKSFLDSIIVELCLPDSPIPKPILVQLLGEATEESPTDAKRFSQAVWDAVGDLSNIIELQSLLDGVLYGPEGEQWKKETRQMPESYENWVDAQIFSLKASESWASYADTVYPLDNTRKKGVLNTVWGIIDDNYTTVSGKAIDDLWDVRDIRHVKPSWHSLTKRNKEDDALALVPAGNGKGGRSGKAKPLAITGGDESDTSMPTLQTVSDSEEEDTDYSDASEWGGDDDDSGGEEGEYDTDEEDELRDWLREAMDAAVASGDFFDPRAPVPEFENLAEERKGNPFLKLLGSLRGRMFPASPTVTTATRDTPLKPFAGRKGGAGSSGAKSPSASTPPTAPPKPRQTTVEEVEDEEAPTTATKKKKKKPKKRKKPASASTTAPAAEGASTAAPPAATPAAPPTSPPSAVKSTTSPPASPAKATPSKAKPTKAKPAPKSTPTPAARTSFSSSTTTLPTFGSTTSLPLSQEQTGQSAHKYLRQEGLAAGKQKVKTRPTAGGLDPVLEKKSKLYSAFRKKSKPEQEADDESDSDSDGGGKKSGGMFSGIRRKTVELMHQVLRTPMDKRQGIADMRWEKFVRMMTDLGFTYVPSTAGSRVRFDPPNPKDRSITFHKPHPDPTIHPKKLRDFSKKLREYYGWDPDDFLKQVEAREDSD
ncbi:hypothetical protein C8Q78DRAFT_985573 [Trametes maxima]|nr:hypothetical protein C8Q78DRAFT_985573 [Trametes maxima]